jgi:outer membrane protein OmpA-like peptidoglycan-associated protein
MKTAESKPIIAAKTATSPFFPKESQSALPFFGEKTADAEPFFSPRTIQSKLTIGKPNDPYEQQADAVADQVVAKINAPTFSVQAKCDHCEQEEKLQKKENGIEQTQTKPIFDSASEPPPDDVQCKTKGNTEGVAISNLSSRLSASKGGGSPLPENTRTSMESAMGADFSNVRVHTGSNAIQMSKDLNAQAFTHGSDVYFNSGKYNPSSTEEDRLLAHELTHVVQQSSAQPKTAQRKMDISMMPTQTIQRGIGDWGIWPWNWGKGDDSKKAPDDKDKELKKVKALGNTVGTNFDSKVSVPNPLPAKGAMGVTMRININFQDTDYKFIEKNILSTDKANLKDWKKSIEKLQKVAPEKLKWSAVEKEKTQKDYQKNIDDVWSSDSSKLNFKLEDPNYEKYQVNNNFKLEFTDKSPHHSFTVVKMIDGAMLRSYMGGAIGGFHDSRTFGGTQFNGTTHNMLAEQLGEFDNNSAKMTPNISTQIDKMVVNINKIKEDHKSDTPVPKWNISLTGRANSTGDKAQNLKISQQRANAVKTELSAKIGKDVSITAGNDAIGNSKTDASTKYRRVEAVFRNTNGSDLNQVTMAHETGHLMGYGDEYGDLQTGGGVLPKFNGDEANDTSKAIRDAGMGEDVVKQHRIENNSDSIMNAGNVVGVGHYSLFLTELKKMATDEKTNAQVNWQVAKG